MKWIEAKVLFCSSDRRLATEILASAFYDAGIKGVVIEGPDEAPVEGWRRIFRNRRSRMPLSGIFPKMTLRPKFAGILKTVFYASAYAKISPQRSVIRISTRKTGPNPGRHFSGPAKSAGTLSSSRPGATILPNPVKLSFCWTREWPLAPEPIPPPLFVSA